MPASDQLPHRRREVVSFVHRGGRMTDGQAHAWDRWWPRYGRTMNDTEAPDTEFALDLTGWFGRDAPVVLEIGSGMGESTAALAAAAPDVDHLAVEVYQPGLAQLLMRIRELGLTNLRMLRADARMVLRDHIHADALAGIRIYFPDPWPKRRHHKRRLVQREFVALVASRIAPGGTLHLATDWAHYAEQMREVCDAEPTLCAERPPGQDWNPRPPFTRPAGPARPAGSAGFRPPAWRPLTKFEQRAEAEGRDVRDLIYRRI
ncbi:MAG: tRNA (guanosine(46)-N7)-methyltransferase TrmB [Actinomycetota bacterium]|nr:tRNA (guanosine(46)-N7)-methyltransferase TrmB [Actinomycetota bacterium]